MSNFFCWFMLLMNRFFVNFFLCWRKSVIQIFLHPFSSIEAIPILWLSFFLRIYSASHICFCSFGYVMIQCWQQSWLTGQFIFSPYLSWLECRWWNVASRGISMFILFLNQWRKWCLVLLDLFCTAFICRIIKEINLGSVLTF